MFQGKTKHFNDKFILLKRRATKGWYESGFCKIEGQSMDIYQVFSTKRIWIYEEEARSLEPQDKEDCWENASDAIKLVSCFIS